MHVRRTRAGAREKSENQLVFAALCSAQVLARAISKSSPVRSVSPASQATCNSVCSHAHLSSGRGVFIHVRAPGDFDHYLVTVTYRTAAGELKTATCGGENPCQSVPAIGERNGMTAGAPWLSRLGEWRRTACGIIVESVAVAKVPAPAVITIGKTNIRQPYEHARRLSRAFEKLSIITSNQEKIMASIAYRRTARLTRRAYQLKCERAGNNSRRRLKQFRWVSLRDKIAAGTILTVPMTLTCGEERRAYPFEWDCRLLRSRRRKR